MGAWGHPVAPVCQRALKDGLSLEQTLTIAPRERTINVGFALTCLRGFLEKHPMCSQAGSTMEMGKGVRTTDFFQKRGLLPGRV